MLLKKKRRKKAPNGLMVLNSFDECETYLSACDISRNSAIKLICTWIQIISKLDPLCYKGSSQSSTVMGKTMF